MGWDPQRVMDGVLKSGAVRGSPLRHMGCVAFWVRSPERWSERIPVENIQDEKCGSFGAFPIAKVAKRVLHGFLG